MRIEYDGKFAFFPRATINEYYTLQDVISFERLHKDATRIKNKVTVLGKADKPYPLDVDGQHWGDVLTESYSQNLSEVKANVAAAQKEVEITEGEAAGNGYQVGDYMWLTDSGSIGEECQIASITPGSGSNDILTMEANIGAAYTTANHAVIWEVTVASKGWGYLPQGAWNDFNVGLDAVTYLIGSKSIGVTFNNAKSYAHIFLVLEEGEEVDMDLYKAIKAMFYFNTTAPSYIQIKLFSGTCSGTTEYAVSQPIRNFQADEWISAIANGGTKNELNWVMASAFDWTDIKIIDFYVVYAAAGTYSFYIDRLHWCGKRWGGGTSHAASDGFAEDSTSQTRYGVRELDFISDLLLSDAECESKAQSLLAFYKSERVTIEVSSDCLNWEGYHPQAGNKIPADLDEVGVTGSSYRIDSIDIVFRALDVSLVTLYTLDNSPAKLADYLYLMGERLRQLERDYKESR